MTEDRFTRSRMLMGDNAFKKLENAHILILGVGGVGSFALDALYRTGVGHITIVDFDRYDITNLNRQMGSEEGVGALKVEVLAKKYPDIKAINLKVDEGWIEAFDFTPYDLVLDAIDDRWAKIALAQKVYKKLISAVGSAKRIDPTQICVDKLWNVKGDAFARKIKHELKKRRFTKNYTVVYSPEQTLCTDKGSFVGVTGAFGLTMASQAIMRLIKD